MRKLAAIVLFGWLLSARATTFYLSSGAAWPAAVAGDTVCITNQWSTPLTIGSSGSAGNPITLLFTNGGCFSSTNFAAGDPTGGGAIQLNGKIYIVIDGAGVGYICNTATGTGLPSLTGSGIEGTASHVVIKNLTITNIYNRTNYADFPNSSINQGGNCIKLTGTDLTVSNCVLADAASLVTLIAGTTGQNTNYSVVNCKLNRANHYVGMSVAENVYYRSVQVSGNTFSNSYVWDGGGGPNNLHVDYMIFQDGASGSAFTNAVIDGFQAYNNIFGPNYFADFSTLTNLGYAFQPSTGYWTNGSQIVGHGATAIVNFYMSSYTNSQVRNSFFFNNIILTHTNEYWVNGIGNAGSNCWTVNNTWVPLEVPQNTCGGYTAASGYYAFAMNNITAPGYGTAIGTLVGYAYTNVPQAGDCASLENIITNGYLNGTLSDYNVCQSVPPLGNDNNLYCGFQWTVGPTLAAGGQFGGYGHSATYLSLNYWRTVNGFCGSISTVTNWYGLHCDPHSVTNPVVFGSGYTPLTNSSAALMGSNLTVIANANNLPQLLVDFNGSNRPASGNWDIGAFNSGFSQAQSVPRFLLPFIK